MSFFLNNGYLVSFIERRLGRHDGTRCYVRDIEMFFFFVVPFQNFKFRSLFGIFGLFKDLFSIS